MFVHMLVTNANLQWSVVGHYLFSHTILSGVAAHAGTHSSGHARGLAIGIVVAVMRLSDNALLQRISWAWIWFFRGVPPLVQLIFWYNLASLVHSVSIGVPYGPIAASWQTNSLITPFTAALLGPGIHRERLCRRDDQGRHPGGPRGRSRPPTRSA